jgi:hypothetical protein
MIKQISENLQTIIVCKYCRTDLRFYSPFAFKKDDEKTEFGIEVELYLSKKLIFISLTVTEIIPMGKLLKICIIGSQ